MSMSRQHSSSRDGKPLLEVRNVTKRFASRKRGPRRHEAAARPAVAGVSLSVYRGETLGIVGESGSGKTTLARCIVRLIDPDEGAVRFADVDLGTLGPSELRAIRRRIQLVSQDSTGALDPRMSAIELVSEPLEIHGVGAAERRAAALDMLDRVGIGPDLAGRKPHEFSGGQRQRINIARGIILRPELVVLDEPVTALDVSVQAQVLNLLVDLQEELGLTYLLIVHDLAIAQHFTDRVVVMYGGELVEAASNDVLFDRPAHPYTHALLSAAPNPDPLHASAERIILPGEVSTDHGRKGCVFAPRCPVTSRPTVCHTQQPVHIELKDDHTASCHLAKEVEAGARTFSADSG